MTYISNKMGGYNSRVESESVLSPTEIEVIFDFKSDMEQKVVDIHVYINKNGTRHVDEQDVKKLINTLVHFSEKRDSRNHKLVSLDVRAQRKVVEQWFPFTEAEPYEYNKGELEAIVDRIKNKLYAIGAGTPPAYGRIPRVCLTWEVPVEPGMNDHITGVMLQLGDAAGIKWEMCETQLNETGRYMSKKLMRSYNM